MDFYENAAGLWVWEVTLLTVRILELERQDPCGSSALLSSEAFGPVCTLAGHPFLRSTSPASFLPSFLWSPLQSSGPRVLGSLDLTPKTVLSKNSVNERFL